MTAPRSGINTLTITVGMDTPKSRTSRLEALHSEDDKQVRGCKRDWSQRSDNVVIFAKPPPSLERNAPIALPDFYENDFFDFEERMLLTMEPPSWLAGCVPVLDPVQGLSGKGRVDFCSNDIFFDYHWMSSLRGITWYQRSCE